MMRSPKVFALVGRYSAIFALLLSAFFGNAGIAFAGFGITPPYVDNDRLTRGTVYKQTINLVRSDPTEDLKASITLNVPDAEDWISVDKGSEFILQKGQPVTPIVVTVKVPQYAEYKEYRGAIRVRTAANNNAPTGAGVSIALGAQIDVRLKVVDKIYDFNVRRIRLSDLEAGRTKWGLYFPGKIRFYMMIENTGNTAFGPTKVHLDIYDSTMEKLLESTDNLNKLKRITPFTTEEIVAELPTRLGAGLYVAKYTIFKNEEIAQQGQVHMSIAAAGTVAGYEGYGFDGLSLVDKLKLISVFGIPLVLLVFFLYIIILRRLSRR